METTADPGALSKALLAEVSGQLGEGDRFSIVTYGSSSQVHLAPLSASADETILDAIESLEEDGSTNMEAGLRLAYEVAGAEVGRADRVRLMLFTDVQPNVGLTAGERVRKACRSRVRNRRRAHSLRPRLWDSTRTCSAA